MEPNLEELFGEKKRKRNPLVPVDTRGFIYDEMRKLLLTNWIFSQSVNLGAFMTAGVLTAGLISFKKGNSKLGQQLMRARVLVQGATVALMVGTAFYYGENPWKSKEFPWKSSKNV
ncbi:hypothetical protein ACFE04_009357 [Oxalis oulophora]